MLAFIRGEETIHLYASSRVEIIKIICFFFFVGKDVQGKCVYLDVVMMVIIPRGPSQHPAPAVCNVVRGEGYTYMYTHKHRAIVSECQNEAYVPTTPSCCCCPGKAVVCSCHWQHPPRQFSG